MKRHRPQVSAEKLASARRLRRDMTVPERLLWGQLRGGRLCGLKFRRQHPFGPYVLDFFCLPQNLAVELDGETHAGRAKHDQRRTEYLQTNGVRVLRVQNDDVIRDLHNVLEGILLACGVALDGSRQRDGPHPVRCANHPLPKGEGLERADPEP
jgi:very-short-patch-repair endonuclease